MSANCEEQLLYVVAHFGYGACQNICKVGITKRPKERIKEFPNEPFNNWELGYYRLYEPLKSTTAYSLEQLVFKRFGRLGKAPLYEWIGAHPIIVSTFIEEMLEVTTIKDAQAYYRDPLFLNYYIHIKKVTGDTLTSFGWRQLSIH